MLQKRYHFKELINELKIEQLIWWLKYLKVYYASVWVKFFKKQNAILAKIAYADSLFASTMGSF